MVTHTQHSVLCSWWSGPPGVAHNKKRYSTAIQNLEHTLTYTDMYLSVVCFELNLSICEKSFLMSPIFAAREQHWPNPAQRFVGATEVLFPIQYHIWILHNGCHVHVDGVRLRHWNAASNGPVVHPLDQWYSTGGTRTPGGTRRHPKIHFFRHLKLII
jgi:hypothetical protein